MAVRAHLTDLEEETHPSGTVYERGSFSANNQKWDVGIVEIGAGNPQAALETERAINYFDPSLVFFVGVAGGIKDVTVGDVVVATKVYGYESGKAEESFKSRPEVGNSSYTLVQRARAERRKKNWLLRISKNGPKTAPRVFVGPIAAGEKVVASKDSSLWEFMRSNYNDALAVEMEGHGFLKAALANQHIKALIVRGISDLIEGKREADAAGSQEIASRHASAFAFEVLAKYALSLSENGSQDARKPSKTGPITETSRINQYPKLRNWLDYLADTEFRDMIRSLLIPSEQTRMDAPVQAINRGDFLGYMQRVRRLDEVEKYLTLRYSERLPNEGEV
ncbi:MAG: hypothetical protein ACPGWR_04665 [Ardenticatenaceae bacterium]